MAVDLNDLIASLQREVNPPGSDTFPTATDDEFLGQLEDAFWESKLFGFFSNYTEADGTVSPIKGTVDLSRDWQQLIVLFAGMRITRMKLVGTNSTFRAKAGPVEFETQNSSNVMTASLKQLQDKIDFLLANLSGSISASQTYYINGLCARNDAFRWGDERWIGE